MKLIKTEDAVGSVLCHDITQIIRGVTKDAVFKKGHIVTEEDIPVLLSVGKEHLYVWENDDTMLHENEAALILAGMCADETSGLVLSEVKEGKIELSAGYDGLLKVDSDRLCRVNSFGEMMIASRRGDRGVRKGDKVAGTRIIPLVIGKDKMEAASRICADGPIFHIMRYVHRKCAIITTGSEVFKGRIEDTFTPVIMDKLSEFDTEILCHEICPDDHEVITGKIKMALDKGADLVICTGGMSVDPDDKTPLAIKNASDDMVTYGAPVLPGAMLALAYTAQGTPIVGLPGCVMYARRTIFDLLLPRLMAGDRVTASQIAALGEGGLCLSCDVCHFPNCSFG